MFKIVDCVEAAPFNAMVAGARGGAGFIPTGASPPALETPRRGPITITSGRAPPIDHDADRDADYDQAPPIDEMPDGPDDGDPDL